MEPILTDTSVLVDFTRSKGSDPRLLRLFASLPLFVCGVVRAELLAGVRSPAERSDLERLLNRLGQLDTDEPVWDHLGDNLVALRRAGISVPFPDLLLATIAVHNDIELWTRDSHFARVQQVLPALRLFPEPP